jgi:hypothetical protein
MVVTTTTHVETVAGEEGIEMPMEVRRAIAVVRQWSRTLTDPPSPMELRGPQRKR